MRFVAILAFLPTIAFAQERPMTSIDFLADFPRLEGQTVMITDCWIAGTTSTFIRCEPPNGAASYAIDASSMDRDDFRWALATCPTGSRWKRQCHVSVKGKVKRSAMPALTNGKIHR